MNETTVAMTEPGCTHPECVLTHPHAGPAIFQLVDDKGRTRIADMSDREIAEETLATLRATQDLVEGFIAQFNSSGAMGSIMSVMKMFSR